MSSATKAKIAAKRKQLIDGTFHVFSGPLYDQSGKLRVPKGKTLTVNGALRDQLARQGRDREREGIEDRSRAIDPLTERAGSLGFPTASGTS